MLFAQFHALISRSSGSEHSSDFGGNEREEEEEEEEESLCLIS